MIQDSDIKQVCTPEDLEVLQQADDTTKSRAIKTAISYFKGFLRNRYDINTIFQDWDGQGEDPRDPALVTFLADYMLYTLYAAQPDRLIPEMRVTRKEDADEWLKGIQSGKINPGFQTWDTEDESDINNPIRFGSGKRTSSVW
jgi:phage gp36-like protein